MIWIHVSLWSWPWVGSCSARPQGDKDLISHYLWLAKWRSPGSTCPSCQLVMAPINQAQSCHWQESSSRTTFALVRQCCLQCVPVTCRHGHYKTPMAQLSIQFPCTAQTVGGKPMFQYGGTRFSAETLFHSHAATICKFAITSLHGEMSLPRLNPWLLRP